MSAKWGTHQNKKAPKDAFLFVVGWIRTGKGVGKTEVFPGEEKDMNIREITEEIIILGGQQALSNVNQRLTN